jgi:hypothetical protein
MDSPLRYVSYFLVINTRNCSRESRMNKGVIMVVVTEQIEHCEYCKDTVVDRIYMKVGADVCYSKHSSGALCTRLNKHNGPHVVCGRRHKKIVWNNDPNDICN